MDDFKKKRIRGGKRPSERIEEERAKREAAEQKAAQKAQQNEHKGKIRRFITQHYIWTAILLVVFVGVTKAGYNIITLAENTSVKEIVLSVFSDPVEKDSENHTNILLLGTGGAEHDGANLTDTMIVASIDHDLDYVSMLSIPRDLYVEIPELYGGNRINSVFELVAEQDIYENETSEDLAYEKSYDVLVRTVSDLLGIPIHYYARIDFNGFVEIVDAIGGIEVDVENALYDPYYPAEDGTDGYQTVAISAGLQQMDGDTALKYVRSRKTTSDFDRAARQQQVIQAIKDRALSLGVLANPSRIKEIYNAIDNNFDTDLEWDEMVYLAKISEKFSSDNMKTWVINDNPLSPGGFLYTPDREYYGGAFVLVPYDETYGDIQTFADLVLMHPEVHAAGTTYQILNGTKTNGVATSTLYYLYRFGFEVVRYGNGPLREVQTTRFLPLTALLEGGDPANIANEPYLQSLLETFIPVGFVTEEVPLEYSPTEWETTADVIIELGQDYVDWMQAHPERFY